MKIKRNNRGFTLIELLAVLVILTAIMGIAIPSISSSLERTKDKQNDSRKKLLTSFAEIYVTDYKNAIYKDLGSSSRCYITLDTLLNKGYINDSDLEDADGNNFNGYIIFDKNSGSCQYGDNISGIARCCKNSSSCQ